LASEPRDAVAAARRKDVGLPSRLDKLWPVFGEIVQEFNERFQQEVR
jgi:hypothetical protein